MATYSEGKKWFDYEFEVSKLNLNDPIPIRKQWADLSAEDRHGEYVYCCETAWENELSLKILKGELGIWEGQWDSYRVDLHRRNGRSLSCKIDLDVRRQKDWPDMSVVEQWELFVCFLEWLEMLEGERQELLRLKEARIRATDPNYSMPFLETGYKYETI